MKLSELEDADQIVTKEYLDAKLSQLELRITQTILSSERAMHSSIDNAKNLIFGTYALIVAAVYINHLWR
jgi:hypothetical protein